MMLLNLGAATKTEWLLQKIQLKMLHNFSTSIDKCLISQSKPYFYWLNTLFQVHSNDTVRLVFG